MSERGSFVTEYIYCEGCLDVVKDILIDDCKYLKGIQIPGWAGLIHDLPIIAGKIGGSYQGEELIHFEYELIPEIKKRICHKMRIAVLADDGERIFYIEPGGE